MKRRWAWLLAGVAALLVVLAGAGALVLGSGWFRERVRQGIVAEIERATGGAVQLGGFSYAWPDLAAEVTDLTVRGTEPADAEPLLHLRSARLDLKILSFWKRQVDLRALVIHDPVIHLVIHPDGSTNLPAPRVAAHRPWDEAILDLAIDRFDVAGGTILIDHRRTPFSAKGENLALRVHYDPRQPAYRGDLRIDPLHIEIDPRRFLDARLDGSLELTKNRLRVVSLLLAAGRSRVEASGGLDNFSAPRLSFEFSTHLDVREAARLARYDFARAGAVDAKGKAEWSNAGWNLAAAIDGQDLGVTTGRWSVARARLTGELSANRAGLLLRKARAGLLGGTFAGEAQLDFDKTYRVEGQIAQVNLTQALAAAGVAAPSWSGALSGPLRLTGPMRGRGLEIDSQLSVDAAAGAIPVSGLVQVGWDGSRNRLDLGESHLATPSSRIDFAGVAGEQLRVRLDSRNLDDFLPALQLISESAPSSLPLRLEQGRAQFDGTVSGPLEQAQIAGKISLARFSAEGRSVDRFTGEVAASATSLKITRATLEAGRTSLTGDASAALANWKIAEQSAVAATLSLRAADVAELLRHAGAGSHPLHGAVTATVRVAGSLGAPRADADIAATDFEWAGETLERARAHVRYAERLLAVRDAEFQSGKATITASLRFAHAPGDYRNGELRFDVRSNEFPLSQFAAMRRLRTGLEGVTRVQASGTARVRDEKGELVLQLQTLDGEIAARQVTLDARLVGTAGIKLTTTGQTLDARFHSDVLGAGVEGKAQWRLEPGYPGSGELVFSKLSLAAVRQWLARDKGDSPLEGTADGKLTFSGPAGDPATNKGSLEISRVELRPHVETGQDPALAALFLRNEGPVVVSFDRGGLRVASAHFLGPSTKLEVVGSLPWQPGAALDLRVNGAINLALLRSLNRDLLASGSVDLNATWRGTLERPSLAGRLALKGASLNLLDLPNGLTNANGVILFSGSHASIQDLTAEVGGGRVTASGFVQFAGDEPTFRVQTRATQVRIRYPEGVSTTANANLTLSGTLRRSLLSGDITVVRTGVNLRTDLSSILAKSSEPFLTPSSRTGPLSGLQFDVRIETSPDLAVDSALARDIQAEATLRLRGTPYNPILLGRVDITQGEITFFGTRYTISHGTVSFINPVKLEPILNLDVETKVRGIDVTLTFSGPINKLNVSHRADPPLEFSEVVALLATGRAPTSDPTLAARQTAQDQQSFAQSGAALVGSAFTNPVSSRLERFFGVSKIKIDPRLTGVDNNPQARLTVEQQVTKDLTFTYITDLSRTNQQIVQIEWSVNRHVSMLVVRDENGLFGVDFLYRKAFK